MRFWPHRHALSAAAGELMNIPTMSVPLTRLRITGIGSV